MKQRQQGFVLILTLFILAAITIAAGYFGERVQKSLQLAEMRQLFNDKLVGINNTRSEALFRLSTTYISPYGLGLPKSAIALDDRPYEYEGTSVQFQDARGLLNINGASDDQLRRFLRVMGVPSDQHAHLIDTLRDYVDADDLRRLEGAESADYISAGLPPPRNKPLISPMELKNIIGWRDMPSLWQGVPVTELVTVASVTAINPNTAPWQVLASLPGVTPEIARAIVARRKLDPISVALLSQMSGANLDVFPPQLIAYPSDNFCITQRAIGMPWAIRYNVRLSPFSDISPWQISYYYRIEEKSDSTLANNAVNPSELEKLPARSVLSPTTTILPLL